MNKTKILSQKIVFQSKFFHIKQVEIKRDGKTFTKDIIERNPVVFILPITSTNDLYLVSQHRDALQRVLLEVVAGTMNDDETDPLLVAQRELQEETGLTAKRWKKIATWELSANMSATIHVFLAQDLKEGEANNDEDENITVVKMPMSDAVEKTMNGEIEPASQVGAILLLEKLVKEGKI